MNWQNALKAALADLRVSGDGLGESLERVTEGKFSAGKIREVLVEELGARLGNLEDYRPGTDVLRLLPADTARLLTVLPLAVERDTLLLAVVDPTDLDLLMDIHVMTGLAIEPVVVDRPALEKRIAFYYKGSGREKSGNQDTLSGEVGGSGGGFIDFTAVRAGRGESEKASPGNRTAQPKLIQSAGRLDSPIVKLVYEIISDAIHGGSSDIHFEPYEKDMKVRLRQDGILRVHRTVNNRSKAEVVSRLKVMADLDIAEKRRPQDGRIRMQGGGQGIDIRVSTLPTEHGEKVVLRILDKAAVPLDLTHLGLDAPRLEVLHKCLRAPFGMILMTGPTGAGKTTTLYSALNLIRSPELNIVTVEDPIEYKLDGVTQTAVKKEVDYTFANALRTILRQDPNVIMVGEIRDRETAEIAVRAALTGHLVLSTLHTNDAPSAVTRLLDMGIEPFLLSSALTLIGAQRLVRRLCPHCVEPGQDFGTGPLEPETLAGTEYPESGPMLRPTKGCPLCHHTGYSGRLGLFEILPITDSIRSLISDKNTAGSLREQAIKEGMVSLREDGLRKIRAGLTSMEEVLRETA